MLMHTVYISHVVYLCCSRGDCPAGMITDKLFISETIESSERVQMCMTISQQSLGRLLNRLSMLVTALAIALAIVASSPDASWAAGDSGNQALNRSATLVAPAPKTKIAVYLRPEANKKRVGYGVNGDSVTVLEQVGDNQSTTWNHVRFDNSPYAEGWVQSEFISPSAAAMPSQGQSFTESNSYLGNRQSQASQQLQNPQQLHTNQQSRFTQQSQANSSNSSQSSSQRNQH